jgi:hypothetical protein
MADAKISALDNLTAADAINDMIPIVDVSATPPASGNTKRISINNLLSSSPTASGALTVTGLVTAGSATITGAATVGTTLGVTGVSTFAAGTALLPALTTTGDVNTGIYYPAADTVAVTTGGVERCRVDSSGYFGVGVSPSKPLQVKLDAVNSGAGWYIIGRLANAAETKGVDIGYNNTSNLATITAISGGVSSGFEFWAYNGGWYKPATIDTSGNLSLSTGNVVMGTSGKGIDFSAVTGGTGTATANVLNDYEEGTFTPTLQFSGLSVGVTYSNRTGIYTKVGRIVHFSGRIDLSSKGTSVGDATIAGLPFAANTGAASVGYQSSVTPSDKQAILTIDTLSLIVRYASGTTTAASTDTNFSNSSILIFAGTYAV